MNTPQPAVRTRLHSLDALKGIDMLCIIGLDAFMHILPSAFPNCSIFSKLASWFHHSPWEGFTFYDLIFPLFVFLSGISMSLSLRKRMESGSNRLRLCGDMVKRGLTLAFIGMVMNGLLSFNFSEIRYPSVLGLIGVAYMLGGLIVLWLRKPGKIALASLAILVGVALLQIIGGDFSREGNVNAIIDRAILPGKLHGGVFDPEGIVCMISASFLTLQGYLAGTILRNEALSPKVKIVRLIMGAGIPLIISALLLGHVMIPIIKPMWTSSFNLLACGCSFVLFGLFYWLVDVLNWKKLSTPFEVIGFNALAIYVGQHFINFSSINDQLFGGIAGLFPAFSGLILAGTVILLKWYILFRMKNANICIKI